MPAEVMVWLPNWQELFIKFLRALLVAGAFELFTFLAARRIEKYLREVFAADAHRDPARRSRRRAKLRASVRATCRAVFYPLAFLVMLDIFGVPAMPLNLAYLAAVAITLVGGHGWLQDVIAGVIILGEDQFAVGDHVQLGEVEGQVERMTLRSTWVRSGDHLHLIANRMITRVRIPARTSAAG